MMKRIILALALGAAGLANAATTVNFGAASSCPTYCYGFTTDDPAYTLGWLNAVYALSSPQHTLLSVNGKTYTGSTQASVFGSATILGRVHTYYDVAGILTAADGSVLTVDYSLEYWTTKVVSGRDAGRLTPHRAIAGGTVTLP